MYCNAEKRFIENNPSKYKGNTCMYYCKNISVSQRGQQALVIRALLMVGAL
jgi:hypothetical protein